MFDLRMFWLRTAVFVLIIGAAIVAAGAALHAFIGMTNQGHPPVVPQAAKIQPPDSTHAPVAIDREAAGPTAVPQPSLLHRKQATVGMTPESQIKMPPVPQIIAPERGSSKRAR